MQSNRQVEKELDFEGVDEGVAIQSSEPRSDAIRFQLQDVNPCAVGPSGSVARAVENHHVTSDDWIEINLDVLDVSPAVLVLTIHK